MNIKLQDFCGAADEWRTWLKQPFSIGDYSYATNGAIAIRVPRQVGVSDLPRDRIRDVQLIIDKPLALAGRYKTISYRVPRQDCDDAGRLLFVDILGLCISAKYARRIRKLPDVKFTVVSAVRSVPLSSALGFRFTGGHGMVMPLKVSRPNVSPTDKRAA
jgi:hypothetical protein